MSQVMFSPDMRSAFAIITTLLNSSVARGGADRLDEPDALTELIDEYLVAYHPLGTPDELASIKQLRARLEDVYRATELGTRIEVINSLLVAAGSIPQLASHPGDEMVHFHYTLDSASFANKITALCAMGLARLIILDAYERLRTCEGERCEKTFIDVSKNGLRRYCDSQTCGNRLHAARYRARLAGAGAQV